VGVAAEFVEIGVRQVAGSTLAPGGRGDRVELAGQQQGGDVAGDRLVLARVGCDAALASFHLRRGF